MKKCPNCNAELEDNFDLCWNCNYSLPDKKILPMEESVKGNKEIDCLRCKVPLVYAGNYKFHEGAHLGMLGNVFEALENKLTFDLYQCPECGVVEFYSK